MLQAPAFARQKLFRTLQRLRKLNVCLWKFDIAYKCAPGIFLIFRNIMSAKNSLKNVPTCHIVHFCIYCFHLCSSEVVLCNFRPMSFLKETKCLFFGSFWYQAFVFCHYRMKLLMAHMFEGGSVYNYDEIDIKLKRKNFSKWLHKLIKRLYLGALCIIDIVIKFFRLFLASAIVCSYF